MSGYFSLLQCRLQLALITFILLVLFSLFVFVAIYINKHKQLLALYSLLSPSRTFPKHQNPLRTYDLSEGLLLLRQYDSEDNKELLFISSSSNSMILRSLSDNQYSINIYSIPDTKKLASIGTDQVAGFTLPVAISDDGLSLALVNCTSNNQYAGVIYNINRPTEHCIEIFFDFSIYYLRFSPDSAWVIANGDGKHSAIYDARKRNISYIDAVGNGGAAISSNSKVAVLADQRSVKFFRIDTAQLLFKLNTNPYYVVKAFIHKNGQFLVTEEIIKTNDHSIKRIVVRSIISMKIISTHESSYNNLFVRELSEYDNSMLVKQDGDTYIYSLPYLGMISKIEDCKKAKYTPDYKYIIGIDSNSAICLWNKATGAKVCVLSEKIAESYRLSEDGKYLCIQDTAGAIDIYKCIGE